MQLKINFYNPSCVVVLWDLTLFIKKTSLDYWLLQLHARRSILSRRLYETISDQPPDVRREVAHHYVVHTTSLLITDRERHGHTEVALLTEDVGHFEALPPSEEVVVEAEPVGRNIDGVPSLKDKTVFWETLAQDPFVLKTIGGYRLEFSEIPPLIYPTETIFHLPRSQQGVGELGEEITSLLRKGAIERVTAVTKGFFSSLFLVSKKGGGGRRPIINLKPLNHYIKKKPFQMSTIKDVSQAIRQDDWSITVDLKDAFLHIPIHLEYRRFLRFQWKGRVYQFCRLPFGLTSSPQVFMDKTRPLMEECRLRGIRVIFYLDDILVLADSYRQASAHRDVLLSLLRRAGFRRSPTKCRLTPNQVFPYLGLEWDSRRMRVLLPQDKMTQIASLSRRMLHTNSVRVSELMALLGKTNFACTIGTIELKTPTTVSTPRQWPVSEGSGQHHLRSKSLPALVDLASKEWTKYQFSLSRQCSSDRRFSERLGCTFQSQTSPRSMVSSSDEESYQLSRAPGGLPVPPALDIDYESPYHCATDRQHYGGGVLGEGGRYSIKSPVRTSSKDSQFCRGTSHQPTMPTNVLLARTVEHRSRHVVSPEGHLGVDVGTCNSKENFPTVRTTPDRPVCISEVETGVKVFHARSTRSQGIGHGCSSSELELQGSTVVRISPANANSSSIGRVHQFRVSVILVTPWWTRAPWIPELMSLSVSLPFCLPEGRSILDITYNTELSLPMVEWNISTAPSRRQGCRIKWPTSLALPGDQERGPSTRPCGTNGSRGVADRVWNLLPRLP